MNVAYLISQLTDIPDRSDINCIFLKNASFQMNKTLDYGIKVSKAVREPPQQKKMDMIIHQTVSNEFHLSCRKQDGQRVDAVDVILLTHKQAAFFLMGRRKMKIGLSRKVGQMDIFALHVIVILSKIRVGRQEKQKNSSISKRFIYLW